MKKALGYVAAFFGGIVTAVVTVCIMLGLLDELDQMEREMEEME